MTIKRTFRELTTVRVLIVAYFGFHFLILSSFWPLVGFPSSLCKVFLGECVFLNLIVVYGRFQLPILGFGQMDLLFLMLPGCFSNNALDNDAGCRFAVTKHAMHLCSAYKNEEVKWMYF